MDNVGTHSPAIYWDHQRSHYLPILWQINVPRSKESLRWRRSAWSPLRWSPITNWPCEVNWSSHLTTLSQEPGMLPKTWKIRFMQTVFEFVFLRMKMRNCGRHSIRWCRAHRLRQTQRQRWQRHQQRMARQVMSNNRFNCGHSVTLRSSKFSLDSEYIIGNNAKTVLAKISLNWSFSLVSTFYPYSE